MYNVIVIGGGIVGLASALKIKERNPRFKVALLEKEKSIARHQTGHNSGVIHSGLYYKPGSFKAKNCVDGYRQLLDFCRTEEVPHEVCGKVVVATSEEEIPYLDELATRGKKNGLEGIRSLGAEGIREIEPHVRGVKGLFIPQTGIVDYKQVAEKYAEKFRHFDGEIYTDHKVTNIRKKNGLMEIVTPRRSFHTRLLVNCSGLQSDQVTRLTGIKPQYRIIPFRGEYYKLKPQSEHLVRNLVYPVPNPNFPFLGVHFTRMISGGVEAGPNAVLAFAREGYRKNHIHLGQLMATLGYKGFRKVAGKYWKIGMGEMYRSFSKAAFTRALQSLIPEIRQKDLIRHGAGVRAQACDREGGLIDDFLVFEKERIINVGNAPSPAATSSLAIGDQVAMMAERQLR
jgi:L-2-hydroxyglutarate oxidase